MKTAMELNKTQVYVEMGCVRCKKGKNITVDIQTMHKDGNVLCGCCHSPMYIRKVWYKDDLEAKRKDAKDKFITPIIAYKITCPKCGGEEIPTHIKDRKSARAWVSGMAFYCNGEGNVLHTKG